MKHFTLITQIVIVAVVCTATTALAEGPSPKMISEDAVQGPGLLLVQLQPGGPMTGAPLKGAPAIVPAPPRPGILPPAPFVNGLLATPATLHEFSATLTRPVGPIGGVVGVGLSLNVMWFCRGNQCTIRLPVALPSVGGCAELAKVVGPLTTYRTSARALNPKELFSCNRAWTPPPPPGPPIHDVDRDGHDAVAFGGDDCDDNDPARYPGNPEIGDAGHDEDCNPTTLGPDGDGDGFVSTQFCNGSVCGFDCDDTRATINPMAIEACDGVDNDCNGLVDESPQVAYYRDKDGDLYGSSDQKDKVMLCPQYATPDLVTNNRDCNDNDPNVNPARGNCR